MAWPDTAYVSSQTGLDPARSYVMQKAGYLHPGFTAPSQFNNQRAEFMPRNPIKGSDPLVLHTEQFCEVMRIYQNSTKDKALANFNIRDKHNWDQVLREAKDAEDKYNESATGIRGMGRKLGRFTGDNAPAINPWLELIPGGDYTSILCGGLKVIFGAAARMSEKRQQILEALGGVPKTIQMAEHCRENFPSDKTLDDITRELYLAILRAIEGMMKWLVDKAGWKQIKAILLGPVHEKPLDEKIQDVKIQSVSLERRVGILRDNAIVRTEASTGRIEGNVNSMDVTTRSIKAETRATNVSVQDIQSGMNNMSLSVENVSSHVSTVVDITSSIKDSQDKQANMLMAGIEKVQSGVDSQNGLMMFLKEKCRVAVWNQKKYKTELQEIRYQNQILRTQLERAQTPVNTPKPIITQAQLVHLLGTDSTTSAQDIQTAFRRGQATESSSNGRIHWMMRSPQFQNWLTSANAQALLIDGSAGSSALDRISPLSFLCTILVQSLGEIQPAICIHFFCGLHTAFDDPLSGASGLIRSLIAQILSAYTFDLSFIATRRHRDELQTHNLLQLCDLFRAIVTQLPIDTVLFCLIDGISLYETSERYQESTFVISKLRELTEDVDLNAVFKLLVTSPSRSRYIKDQIAPEDQLALPRDEGRDRDMLTERQIMMQMRRPMGSQQGSYRTEADEVEEEGGEAEEEEEEVDFDEGNLSDEGSET